MRIRLVLIFFALGVAVGCGGGEPEAEATWETHTTAPDNSSGGEDGSEPE